MEKELVQGLDHDENTTMPCYRSNVDNSRPFRSVKEAVAIFGERFLVGDVYSPKSFALPEKEAPFFSPSPNWKVEKESSLKHSSEFGKVKNNQRLSVSDTIKKLEEELKEAKAELKILKERESESDMALAIVNTELYKNNSDMTRAEEVMAGKVVASLDDRAMVIWEEERKRDEYISNSTSLAEILSMGDFIVGRKREKKVMKKKPIIPLIGDLFSRRKSSSSSLHNYTSPLQWN